MKPTKRIYIPALLPALLAAVIGLTDRSVRADSGIHVPPIHFSHLEPVAGKFLQMFFVHAKAPSIMLPGAQLEIQAIMAPPIRIQIPASGIVDIASPFVPNEEGLTYNYVYVAVTDAVPNPLFLKNPEDPVKEMNDSEAHPDLSDIVSDPRISKMELWKIRKQVLPFQTLSLRILSRYAFMKHNQNGTVMIDALTDLPQ
jgi:hypothetical protein